MVQQIPTLIDLQKKLLDMLLKTSKTCGIPLSLHRYRDSPRLTLRVPTYEMLHILLAACDRDAIISDPVTHDRLCLQTLQDRPSPAIRLWYPIIVHGRMIHGAPSGIDLIVATLQKPALPVRLPHRAFADLWLNTLCEGQEINVDPALMQRLSDTQQPAKVDVVLTWVDDQDPSWQEKRARFTPKAATLDAADPARFANNDELLYTLRGLFRYFDGLGQVYLVTDGQTPAFWAEFADRVRLVHHDDIMEADVARPTFNSHVIESCLHKIQGLSAQYMYLNDDVIIANAAGVCDFFDDQGRAKVFYSKTTFVPDGPRSDHMLAVDTAAINTRDLLAEAFNFPVTRKFQHCPIAINRSVICDLEQRFTNLFQTLRQNRFRSPVDVAPSGSLYQHYALMTDQAVTSEIAYRYLRMTGPTMPAVLLLLSILPASNRPVVVCLNAVTGGAGSWLNRFALRWQMTRLFPPDTAQNTAYLWRTALHRAALDALLWTLFRLRRLKS